MTQRKVLYRFISIMMVAVLVIGGLYVLSPLLERKESLEKRGSFYQQQEDLDVLFLGTSHGLTAISPMEMWNEEGIASYNMCAHGSMMIMNYWIMRNCFAHSIPKIVVVDAFHISSDDKRADGQEGIDQQHFALDVMPFGREKIDALLDITEPGERAQFLWDFVVYHNRWQDLDQSDFELQYTAEKGSESWARIMREPAEDSEAGDMIEESLGKEYLIRIIEECQAQGIEVVLTHIPYVKEPFTESEDKMAAEMAATYGIPFLSYDQLKEQIDFETDLSDRGHLNVSGRNKITGYLGRFLKENYALVDHRDEASYASWKDDYNAYLDAKVETIKEQDTLENLLLLLDDTNFTSELTFPEDHILWEDSIVKKLLMQADITPKPDPSEQNIHIRVTDRRNDQIIYDGKFYETKKLIGIN